MVSEAGAQIRKGEKSAYVVFYKEITLASDDGNSEEADTRLFARATPVFAAEQVDGWTPPTIDAPATIITPIERLLIGHRRAKPYPAARCR